MLQLFSRASLITKKKSLRAACSALCGPQVVIPLMVKSPGWSDSCFSESYLPWGFMCPFLTVTSEHFLLACLHNSRMQCFLLTHSSSSLRIWSDTETSLLLCWKALPGERHEEFICIFGVCPLGRMGKPRHFSSLFFVMLDCDNRVWLRRLAAPFLLRCWLRGRKNQSCWVTFGLCFTSCLWLAILWIFPIKIILVPGVSFCWGKQSCCYSKHTVRPLLRVLVKLACFPSWFAHKK